jgi:hypothetical protein
MKPSKNEGFTKDLQGELQEIVRGIKLTEEAEKVLRLLLKYTDRIGRYPKSFEPDHVELIQDLIVLLNHRNVQRKRLKKLEYIHNRNLLIPKAEAIAYIKLREEAYPDSTEEYNTKFNLYFHTAMSNLAFEHFGTTDSVTIGRASGASIKGR